MIEIYCVYLTIYSGSLLPPFYIGSSTINKIDKGYRGSVSSKLYKNIWKKELKENPNLFKTIILCSFSDRKLALDKEEYFHKKLNVHNNVLYINQCTAKGSFGLIYTGNPGKRSEETKLKISINRKNKSIGKRSEQWCKSISESLIGHDVSIETREKLKIANIDKHLSNETKRKIGDYQRFKKKDPESIKKRTETRRKNKLLRISHQSAV